MLKVFKKDHWMKFQNHIILPSLTPQTAIYGLYNEANDNYNLLSHVFFIDFKYYIYTSRKKRTLNIDILIVDLIKVKEREKKISYHCYHQ